MLGASHPSFLRKTKRLLFSVFHGTVEILHTQSEEMRRASALPAAVVRAPRCSLVTADSMCSGLHSVTVTRRCPGSTFSPSDLASSPHQPLPKSLFEARVWPWIPQTYEQRALITELDLPLFSMSLRRRYGPPALMLQQFSDVVASENGFIWKKMSDAALTTPLPASIPPPADSPHAAEDPAVTRSRDVATASPIAGLVTARREQQRSRIDPLSILDEQAGLVSAGGISMLPSRGKPTTIVSSAAWSKDIQSRVVPREGEAAVTTTTMARQGANNTPIDDSVQLTVNVTRVPPSQLLATAAASSLTQHISTTSPQQRADFVKRVAPLIPFKLPVPLSHVAAAMPADVRASYPNLALYLSRFPDDVELLFSAAEATLVLVRRKVGLDAGAAAAVSGTTDLGRTVGSTLLRRFTRQRMPKAWVLWIAATYIPLVGRTLHALERATGWWETNYLNCARHPAITTPVTQNREERSEKKIEIPTVAPVRDRQAALNDLDAGSSRVARDIIPSKATLYGHLLDVVGDHPDVLAVDVTSDQGVVIYHRCVLEALTVARVALRPQRTAVHPPESTSTSQTEPHSTISRSPEAVPCSIIPAYLSSASSLDQSRTTAVISDTLEQLARSLAHEREARFLAERERDVVHETLDHLVDSLVRHGRGRRRRLAAVLLRRGSPL